jgi:ABC-type glycerol-3-phosphate transport system substrate-binding protein
MVRFANREVEHNPLNEAETFSFHYDTATGKPRIAGPGFVRALTLLQRLQVYRASAQSAAPEEAFRDGHAVMCITDASWITRFQKSVTVAGKFDITTMPGAEIVLTYQGVPKTMDRPNRVPYLGAAGWVAVVPATTTHRDAAFAFLEDLNSIETGRQIVSNARWGSGAFRDEHLAKPEIWNSYGLSSDQRGRLVEEMKQTLACPGLKNPAFRLRTPDEQKHEQILIEEIRAAILSGKDPAEALMDVEHRWGELDRAVPQEERRTQYLRSLGLHL